MSDVPDPFQRAQDIRAGKLDDQMPMYEELTGWLQRVPVTWLPGLLIRVVSLCVICRVFKDGGIQKVVASTIETAGTPGSFFRTGE